MHVTNPAALWLLLLLAIPLLLARRRTPPARRAVANLYLWRDLAHRDPSHLSVRRLRKNWLVALQIALLAAIVAALSGPVVACRESRIALVVDVSMSMGARDGSVTRLERVRQRARALLSDLPRGAAVRLITAGPAPRDLGEHPAGDPTLGRLLDNLVPTSGRADVSAAIQMATAGNARVDHVHVLTDGTTRDVASPGASVAPIIWERAGTPAENVAVSRIAARPLSGGNGAGLVMVEVRNFGARPADARVEVTQDGVVIGQQSISVAAHGVGTLALRTPRLGQTVRARLVGEDALGADDSRVATVPQPSRAVVRLAAPASYFLQKALAANPRVALESGAELVETNTKVARPAPAAFRAADVVVCEGCTAPPDGTESVLLIAPRAGLLPPAPLTISAPAHPLTALLEHGTLDVMPIQRPVEAAPGSVVLRAGGRPVATAYERNGRRFVEWHFDIDGADFALSATFPILVANAIDWLAGRDRNPSDGVAGEPMQWVLPAEFPSNLVSVTGPDGRAVAARLQGRFLTVTDTDATGVYRVRSPREERVFVVNPPVDDESDLSAAASDAFDSTRRNPGTAAPVRMDRSLMPLFVLLALALLAAEWRYRWKWEGRST